MKAEHVIMKLFCTNKKLPLSANRMNQRGLRAAPGSGEAGFSLIEVAVAMVVIMVAMLGVFLTITYAISYNAGNYSRAQSLAVLQREAEQMRSAKFTPSSTDPILQGGIKADKAVSLPNGTSYVISTVVDNDPFTAGVQDESVFTAYKEIKITAKTSNRSPGWQTAIPATVVLRRVKSN
ncbi:MAG: prepilin-type N-terminal cleavage/methylation domain-containing protein [Pyrinomonadaceae bacterium]